MICWAAVERWIQQDIAEDAAENAALTGTIREHNVGGVQRDGKNSNPVNGNKAHGVEVGIGDGSTGSRQYPPPIGMANDRNVSQPTSIVNHNAHTVPIIPFTTSSVRLPGRPVILAKPRQPDMRTARYRWWSDICSGQTPQCAGSSSPCAIITSGYPPDRRRLRLHRAKRCFYQRLPRKKATIAAQSVRRFWHDAKRTKVGVRGADKRPTTSASALKNPAASAALSF